MDDVACWSGCARGCSGWWGLRAATRSRAAAVRAGNQIGDDGAVSLAPSLRWMTQLTSLNLNSTLVCIGSVGLRCGLGSVVRGALAGGRGLRGARRGAAVACRQSNRSSWGGTVEVLRPSIMHGATLSPLGFCPSAPDVAKAEEAGSSVQGQTVSNTVDIKVILARSVARVARCAVQCRWGG
jgi:hypothetical protein